jgi:tRNA nucleotidyltransferase/poly(A) polymerase
MPDYIYLLENRLSPSQQSALQTIREAAREAGMTVFLTGGAVRDLTSGSPVRDLDVSVQGNALELKHKLEHAGAVLWGEHEASQTLFARFPGSVRVEVSSTRREEFPKPGRPVYHSGSILEDLRRRDFTANAMALSLNEGSYGLLMDPLNGVADLEARLLRLVSNYGFLEDPIRLIRASRLKARLGWELDEKTKVRFDNAREEGVISQISSYQQGYEVEEILHEEDGLKILKALEADGWMKSLYPAWTSEKVDVEALEALREALVQLQMQGVNPDPSAAQAQLLTAKLGPKDLAGLKKLFARPGFVREWETQEDRAKEVGKRLTGKEASTPSETWKLLTSADPEAILWLSLTSKSAPVQEKFKDFFTVWPEARQKIPYAIMQEMRIVPELEGYQELLRSIFFQLIDGKLTSDEEIRQFLEPYSPPAPPPPVSIRRTRSKKSADKSREVRDEVDEDEAGEAHGVRDEDSEEEENGEDDHERHELVARVIPPIIPDPILLPPVAAPSVEVVEEATAAAPPIVPDIHPTESRAEKPPASAKAHSKAKPKVAPLAAPKAPVKQAATEPVKKPVKEVVKEAMPKQPVAVPAKAAVHSVAKMPVKSASKASPGKAVGRTVSKPVAKPALRPGLKAAGKPKAAAKPAIKAKAAIKKTALKPAVKGNSGRVLAKAKPAKAIVKPKAAKAVVKSALKAKPASKFAAKAKGKAAPKKKR